MKNKLIALVLVLAGIAIGAVVTIAALRASRTEGSFLYNIRERMGAAPQDTSELNWLARTYGPEIQSQGPEEWIVRDFFKDKKQGVFVDVGAADYKLHSNTWFLEHDLGWSGVAIDAQADYAGGYTQNRPKTKFFSLFVSDVSHENAKLYIEAGRGASSSHERFAENHGAITGTVEVPTITLNDLLDGQGIATFDFLSMDIELAEPKALAGLDLHKFKPALACVEVHPQVRQQILDYFTANGYVVVGKYLRVDQENMWFMPAGTVVEPLPVDKIE